MYSFKKLGIPLLMNLCEPLPPPPPLFPSEKKNWHGSQGNDVKYQHLYLQKRDISTTWKWGEKRMLTTGQNRNQNCEANPNFQMNYCSIKESWNSFDVISFDLSKFGRRTRTRRDATWCNVICIMRKSKNFDRLRLFYYFVLFDLLFCLKS